MSFVGMSLAKVCPTRGRLGIANSCITSSLSYFYSTHTDKFRRGVTLSNKINSTFKNVVGTTEKLDFLRSILRSNEVKITAVSISISAANSLDPGFKSVEEAVLLINYFEGNNIIGHFLRDFLADQVKVLDFESTLFLVRYLDSNSKAVDNQVLFECVYTRLTKLFIEKMINNDNIEFNKLFDAIDLPRKHRYVPGLNKAVMEYLTNHIVRFNIREVAALLDLITQYKPLKPFQDEAFLLSARTSILKVIFQRPCVQERSRSWGRRYDKWLKRFFLFYGRIEFYDEEIWSAVKELIYGPEDPQIHSENFLSFLIATCSQCSYYDQGLCDYVSKFFIANVESINPSLLTKVLNSFTKLNYRHSDFLDAVIQSLPYLYLENGINWGIMNSCLYHNKYYPEVLKSLTDHNIQASMVSDVNGRMNTFFLRLLFSLSAENPQLGLRKYSPGTPNAYPYHIKGIKDIHALNSLKWHLKQYGKHAKTIGNANCYRALKAVTRGHVHPEGATLIGYIIDFEVLLDKQKFCAPPRIMKSCPLHIGLKVVGVDAPAPFKKDIFSHGKKNPLIDILKNSESSEVSHNARFDATLMRGRNKSSSYVTFASDWMKLFDSKLPKYRRIAIEVNGPHHYAANHRTRMMGPDAVKVRLLKAMGCELVQIPYYEWHDLKTGDDHIKYVKSKLHDTIGK